ncbi:MAG TPA: hypothetical protein VGY66_12010 [Gemmataceae bacterium]|nr:hypothetical protein [Gemmataceae bacterium]
MPRPQNALKYEVEVSEKGSVEVPVPFPAGSRVIVFVVEENDDAFSDLASAAQTSLEFWNNPLDDEDWNNA